MVRPMVFTPGRIASIFLTVCVAALVTAPSGLAQEDVAEHPTANPEDVKSPDAIVTAAFEAISNGQWERFRSLHHPNFQWITLERQDGELSHEVRTLDESVEALRSAVGDSVSQHPTSIEVKRRGELAHVLVPVETRTTSDNKVLNRGLDSLELWYDENRWWIMTVM